MCPQAVPQRNNRPEARGGIGSNGHFLWDKGPDKSEPDLSTDRSEQDDYGSSSRRAQRGGLDTHLGWTLNPSENLGLWL